MKSKKFNTVEAVRAIRDENYEKTKGLTRGELLSEYKRRSKEAMKIIQHSTEISRTAN